MTAFDVVDVCEQQPYRFQVNGNNTYGLSLWCEASQYRQPLAELLSDKPLYVKQIVDRLSPQESDQAQLIVAALNFYKDTFVETAPFEWALKRNTDGLETELGLEYTDLTFEDLIPE